MPDHSLPSTRVDTNPHVLPHKSCECKGSKRVVFSSLARGFNHEYLTYIWDTDNSICAVQECFGASCTYAVVLAICMRGPVD